jgi:hypothetical protein
MKSRAAWLLVVFLASLHALVIVELWRQSDGRIAQGVVLVSIIPLIFAGSYLLGRLSRPMTWLDAWVLAYAAWSAVSLVLYFQPGNPSGVGAYAYGLYHFVLPIACYFAVKTVPQAEHPRVIGALIVLNAIAIGYGLYLHFTRPDFYLAFVAQRLYQQGLLQEWQYFARLQSYLGSTSIGYLGAASLVLATLANARLRRWLPVLVPLFFAGAVLSFQRASIVAVVMALIYLMFFARQHVALRLVVVAVLIGSVIYGIVRLEAAGVLLRESLQSRATTELVEGLAEFADDRGYGPGFWYVRSFPFGVGIGATSSAAAQVGLVGAGEVVDANFMRIAADLGVVGSLLFLLVLAAGFWRASHSRHRAAWLTFLVIHVGIMLSTNVLDSFYISQSFWLLLAMIDCDRDPLRVASAVRVIETPVFPRSLAVR